MAKTTNIKCTFVYSHHIAIKETLSRRSDWRWVSTEHHWLLLLLSALGCGGFPAMLSGLIYKSSITLIIMQSMPQRLSLCCWLRLAWELQRRSALQRLWSQCRPHSRDSSANAAPLESILLCFKVVLSLESFADSPGTFLTVQPSKPWRLWSSCCSCSSSVRLWVSDWVSLPSSLI